jgi:large subunit ribosomal protein L13e
MPKHNNSLHNTHLRKHWQKWVKSNFNQPAKKLRRLKNRRSKAQALFPRPIKALRPVVRGCTKRYNRRVREGKGFTLEELAAAKVAPAFAKTIGIAVDHRRTNRSTESKQLNVARLKAYKEKLVLLPKKAGKPKKGVAGVLSDTPNVEASNQTQVQMDVALPMTQDVKREKPMTISKGLKSFQCHRQIRQEWSNKKHFGKREIF